MKTKQKVKIVHWSSYWAAWRQMNQRSRLKLLEDLAVPAEFGEGKSFCELAKQNDFIKLPMRIRVILGPAYSNGCFSKTIHDQNFESLRACARSVGLYM